MNTPQNHLTASERIAALQHLTVRQLIDVLYVGPVTEPVGTSPRPVAAVSRPWKTCGLVERLLVPMHAMWPLGPPLK